MHFSGQRSGVTIAPMSTPLHTLLVRLLALRLLMTSLGAAALIVAWLWHYPLLLAPMTMVLALNAGSVIVHGWRLRSGWEPGEADIALQLAQDILALLLLLYFAGGASNPFLSLLLFPLAIAASMLPRRWVWLLAAEALAGWLILLLEYQPLPPLTAEMTRLGMAANFLLTAALLAGFVSWLNRHLRARDQEIQRLRETAQRQEQLLGVATLAAGAAHELGTPLNTLGLLIEERLADQPGIEARADLLLMQQQVHVCRKVLSRLSLSAREYGQMPVSLRLALQQLFDYWLAMRPQVRLELHWPDGEAPVVRWSPLLDQALLNLCNNAADASDEPVSITMTWTDALCLHIDDCGPGPSPAMLAATPSPVNSSKHAGMGLGVWLSNASLERFNGRVCYVERSHGGTRTTVEIPLEALQ